MHKNGKLDFFYWLFFSIKALEMLKFTYNKLIRGKNFEILDYLNNTPIIPIIKRLKIRIK